MAILNIYHREPLVSVPGWLKTTTWCLSGTICNRHVGNELVGNQQEENDTTEPSAMGEATCERQQSIENDAIMSELRKITERLDSHGVDEKLREEWRNVGQALDRFFFLLFITIQLSLTLVTVGRLPSADIPNMKQG